MSNEIKENNMELPSPSEVEQMFENQKREAAKAAETEAEEEIYIPKLDDYLSGDVNKLLLSNHQDEMTRIYRSSNNGNVRVKDDVIKPEMKIFSHVIDILNNTISERNPLMDIFFVPRGNKSLQFTRQEYLACMSSSLKTLLMDPYVSLTGSTTKAKYPNLRRKIITNDLTMEYTPQEFQLAIESLAGFARSGYSPDNVSTADEGSGAALSTVNCIQDEMTISDSRYPNLLHNNYMKVFGFVAFAHDWTEVRIELFRKALCFVK